MAKRGYKLQEFVAHASGVNCLSIGKKSSRLLVTGGDDHNVNLWAIGKPTSLMSLSGHTSSVESVTFDSAEVLVVSGASTGAIKLWDLEEAKTVRTLTGHRSHCNAVEFHPFGEFFASGSSDTNLKIWDVRKKGCIHTYKGHTQGVSTIRFTPDGRWVVSGGADSVVKVWDLTAGKLLHELKFHDGEIQCLDFHPLEFLLATGSADRTVNFWDLETFELIGSAGPETTGVRSMTFHPDGKTLFCGLEDNLKVFSWEPIICHDSVNMGWSLLGDLNIHNGKLLACSYYRNCVGVWVADISLIGPYGAGVSPQSKGLAERRFDNQESHSADKLRSHIKANPGLLTTAHDNETLEIRNIYVDTSASKKATPESINTSNVAPQPDSSEAINASSSKRSPETEVQTRSNSQVAGRRAITVPVVVPRYNPNTEHAVNSRRESMTPESTGSGMLLKSTHIRRESNKKYVKDLSGRAESRCSTSQTSDFDSSPEPKFRFSFFPAKNEASEASDDNRQNIGSVTDKFERVLSPDAPPSSGHETCADPQNYSRAISSSRPVNGGVRHGRTRSLVERFERREICNKNEAVITTATSEAVATSTAAVTTTTTMGAVATSTSEVSTTVTTGAVITTAPTEAVTTTASNEAITTTGSTEAVTTTASTEGVPINLSPLHVSKGHPQTSESKSTSNNDEDVMEDLLQNHDAFLGSLRSRLTKLQVVRHFWQRNDIKGGVNAVGKLPDHYVQADVVSVLMEKMDIVTLDLFYCLLPMVMGLLISQIDRHTSVSLEMLLKLVAIFGPVIRSTMSASPSVGVDLQAERRRERCTQCFIQLQKIKHVLPSVIRRGGLLAKSAQELNLVLRDS